MMDQLHPASSLALSSPRERHLVTFDPHGALLNQSRGTHEGSKVNVQQHVRKKGSMELSTRETRRLWRSVRYTVQ